MPLLENPRGGKMLAIRGRLGFTRELFARLLPTSVRSLAMIEAGGTPGESVSRRLHELRRVVDALGEVMQPAFVGEWMQTPNDAFDGLKPLEVIERGETDRIWQMIYQLRSGSPV
jgi:hypothetical protein